MKKLIFILTAAIILQCGVCSAEEAPQSVKASLLMEASTGEVLSEFNADERLPIASVTKIMTMLIIMEKIDAGELNLTDTVTASANANSYGGSTMFLETGEQLSVHDMLKGIAVASANDGCVAMAEHICGTENDFVALMNKRAEELGMANTHFMNSNGLDEENHYSSARDVAIMSRELIKHKTIFDYTKIWTDSLRGGKFELANTNKLIRYYNGATGLKTGSTSKAGCCLSATAERDGMELIAVVLGAPDTKTRFSTASNLLNYGFGGYRVVSPIENGEPVGRVHVSLGKTPNVACEAAEGYTILENKNEKHQNERTVHMEDSVTAPVHKGDKLGEITCLRDGAVIKTVDIVASEDVEKKGFYLIFTDLLYALITGKMQ